ncbi:MAG TPA: biotin/lipoate--protein ligase family protein [Beijerinckiaceae bacterium]
MTRDDDRLDLPPGFTEIALRERGDAFAHACAVAAEQGAGALVRTRRYDLVEFAVVLEPDEPLAGARRALFAGMHALAEAVAAHCPPEREIAFAWPDALLFEGGLVGGGRVGWPAGCAEDAVPDWLVFGAMLRAVDMSHVDAGLHPGVTALVTEGFELIATEAVAESFARHLMLAFDMWRERGFRAVGEAYLQRLPKRKAGERRILDERGDLLTSLPAGGPPDRAPFPRDPAAAPTWLDARTGAPRIG